MIVLTQYKRVVYYGVGGLLARSLGHTGPISLGYQLYQRNTISPPDTSLTEGFCLIAEDVP